MFLVTNTNAIDNSMPFFELKEFIAPPPPPPVDIYINPLPPPAFDSIPGLV